MFIHICNYSSQLSWIINLGIKGIARTKLHTSFASRITLGNGGERKGIRLSHLQEALKLLLSQNSRNNAMLLTQSLLEGLRDYVMPDSSDRRGI